MKEDGGLYIAGNKQEIKKKAAKSMYVSRSVYLHSYVSQAPLQDPCPTSMSQQLYIARASAKSMSPMHEINHPYHPIFWPCAGETKILTSGDALCGRAQGKQSGQDPNFDLRGRVLCCPAQRKQSNQVFLRSARISFSVNENFAACWDRLLLQGF